jgi:hypothetical protein
MVPVLHRPAALRLYGGPAVTAVDERPTPTPDRERILAFLAAWEGHRYPPSTGTIADMLDVHMATLRPQLFQLKREGLIHGGPGNGTSSFRWVLST